MGIAVGVADLCSGASSQGDDAADPFHHLPLGDDQQVMDVSRLQQVAETDRKTDFRLIRLTQTSGHMVMRVLQVVLKVSRSTAELHRRPLVRPLVQQEVRDWHTH